MIITATGLHGSGKSHLLQLIASRHSIPYFTKKSALEQLSPEQDWTAWYRREYKELGAYKMTEKILGFCPKVDLFIYDAVHNPKELKALVDYDPDTKLIGVFCQKSIRDSRNGDEDRTLDDKRIGYWHEPITAEEQPCLLSQVEWAFNGCMDEKLLVVCVDAFIQQLNF